MMGYTGNEYSIPGIIFEELTQALTAALGMPPAKAWLVFLFVAGAAFYALFYLTRFVKSKPDTVKSFQSREDPERRRVLDMERRKARERQLQRLREQEKKAAAERERKEHEKRMKKLKRTSPSRCEKVRRRKPDKSVTDQDVVRSFLPAHR